MSFQLFWFLAFALPAAVALLMPNLKMLGVWALVAGGALTWIIWRQMSRSAGPEDEDSFGVAMVVMFALTAAIGLLIGAAVRLAVILLRRRAGSVPAVRR
jgi:hypothetical protein